MATRQQKIVSAICTSCGETKSAENFHKCSIKANGLDSRCKQCKKDKYDLEAVANRAKARARYWSDEGTEIRNTRNSTLDGFLKILLRCDIKDRGDSLTLEELRELWDRQDGLCAVTLKPMTHTAGQGKQPNNVSIDRIDNDKGYSIDNVQLVRACVNYMRHTLTMDELYQLCGEVLDGKAS